MRKFYKTTITIEILHEDPIYFEGMTLADVEHEFAEGSCSGEWSVTKTEELNAKETVVALEDQGSDPDFFQLDEEGDDLDCCPLCYSKMVPHSCGDLNTTMCEGCGYSPEFEDEE